MCLNFSACPHVHARIRNYPLPSFPCFLFVARGILILICSLVAAPMAVLRLRRVRPSGTATRVGDITSAPMAVLRLRCVRPSGTEVMGCRYVLRERSAPKKVRGVLTPKLIFIGTQKSARWFRSQTFSSALKKVRGVLSSQTFSSALKKVRGVLGTQYFVSKYSLSKMYGHHLSTVSILAQAVLF